MMRILNTVSKTKLNLDAIVELLFLLQPPSDTTDDETAVGALNMRQFNCPRRPKTKKLVNERDAVFPAGLNSLLGKDLFVDIVKGKHQGLYRSIPDLHHLTYFLFLIC